MTQTDRRAFLTLAASGAALTGLAACTSARAAFSPGLSALPTVPGVLAGSGRFSLAPLPYGEDALAPVIDAETMRLHHGLHHNAYVNGLNDAIARDPALAPLTLEQMHARMSTLPAAVRNNGGGHYNHTLFWALMAPPGTGGAPSPALLARIERDFGSLEAMREAFNQAGTGQFGAGWAWLIWTGQRLEVTSTPNQDNPLMDLAGTRGQPILANDVWEHAYYLGYRNRRAEYLSAWWQVVNWSVASALFDQARAGT